MKVTLLGTAAARSDVNRFPSSNLIQVVGRNFLVDCGAGSLHQLMKAGLDATQLDGIFLTHRHIDHCAEFPAIMFSYFLMGGEKEKFPLYGGPDLVKFELGLFNGAYDFASDMMMGLRDRKILVDVITSTGGVIYDQDGLIVRCQKVEHDPLVDSLAFRFEQDGKSVVFSGDVVYCENLVKISHKCDVLISDFSFPEDGKCYKGGHIKPSEVGRVAKEAGVKRIVASHLSTPWNDQLNKLEEMVRSGGFTGEIVIGSDLMSFAV